MDQMGRVTDWDVRPLYEQLLNRDDHRGYYEPYSGLLVYGGASQVTDDTSWPGCFLP